MRLNPYGFEDGLTNFLEFLNHTSPIDAQRYERVFRPTVLHFYRDFENNICQSILTMATYKLRDHFSAFDKNIFKPFWSGFKEIQSFIESLWLSKSATKIYIYELYKTENNLAHDYKKAIIFVRLAFPDLKDDLKTIGGLPNLVKEIGMAETLKKYKDEFISQKGLRRELKNKFPDKKNMVELWERLQGCGVT